MSDPMLDSTPHPSVCPPLGEREGQPPPPPPPPPPPASSLRQSAALACSREEKGEGLQFEMSLDDSVPPDVELSELVGEIVLTSETESDAAVVVAMDVTGQEEVEPETVELPSFSKPEGSLINIWSDETKLVSGTYFEINVRARLESAERRLESAERAISSLGTRVGELVFTFRDLELLVERFGYVLNALEQRMDAVDRRGQQQAGYGSQRGRGSGYYRGGRGRA